MTNHDILENILKTINRKSNDYVRGIYGLLLIFTAILFFILASSSSIDKVNKVYSLILVFAGPAIAFSAFYCVVNIKTDGKYLLFRRFILLKRKYKEAYSTSHFLRSFLRAVISFTITLAIIGSGAVAIILCDNLKIPLKYAGAIISYYSFVFVVCYGVVALPRIIALRTKNHQYATFYWLQFYKSLMSGSPIFTYFSILLYVIACIVLSLVTFVIFNDPSTTLLKAFTNSEFSGLILSTGSIWLTVILAIGNDFLQNYSRLDKCYENHTTYTLRKHILDGEKFVYILVGMGNLGKITAGYIVPQLLKKQDEFMKKPMAHFECIIDRDYKLRLFPRTVVAIELNQAIFEETRIDANSGLTYGFVSGKDLISEMANNQRLPESIALFALNGDGGTLPMLKLADYDSSKIIINTSSDKDMGLRLKMLVERESLSAKGSKQVPQNLPSIITTVEDSSIYSFLESENRVTMFPLHAGIIEGNSIATRLLNMVMNLMSHKKRLSDIQLAILGNGKTIYYCISTFHKLLLMVFSEDQVKELFEKNLVVVCDDPHLTGEIRIKAESTIRSYDFYDWDYYIDNRHRYQLSLIHNHPASYYSMQQTFELLTHYKTANYQSIAVFSTRNPNDAIRICQHLRQAASDYRLDKLGVLASVSIEIEAEIAQNLSDFPAFQHYIDEYPGFPSAVNDLILKKNLIIGNQIISISDCLDKYSLATTQEEKQTVSGEIAFCCNNQPGAFVSLVVKLGNLELPATTELRNVNPGFYNNFTYTLRIPSTKNAYPFFVFRGDAFLTAKPLKMNGFDEITSSINGNKEFRSKIEAVLTEMNAGKESCSNTCGYNTRCPVSNGHTRQHLPIRRKPYKLEQNACIKIVGCNDEIPGSFALALSDLLMMNASIHTTGNELDLVYCASSICDYPQRFINRFYLQFKKPDSSEQTLKALNRQRTIVAIKIKPVKPNSKSWHLYATDLVSYLNSVCKKPDEFKIESVKGCIIIKREIGNVALSNYINEIL